MSKHEHCHEHEHNSMEEAGGVAAGFNATLHCWNADAEARICDAMMHVGHWVEHESGAFLGHIKASVVAEDGRGETLNLTVLDSGVEHHGVLGPQDKVAFTFMCAVLDVDKHELEHMMFHEIDDSGVDCEFDEDAKARHQHFHEHHHEHHHDECHCHERE